MLKARIILLTTIMLYAICVKMHAQSRKSDSLQTVLSTTSGKQRYKVLNDLCLEVLDKDNLLSLKYANEALKLSYQLGDSLDIVQSCRINGYILFQLGKLVPSIKILSDGLKISERQSYRDETKFILNNLANVYLYSAKYDKALTSYFKSLELRKNDGNNSELSIVLSNIGNLYYNLENYDKAIDYFNQSVSLKKIANDTYDLNRVLINLSLAKAQNKDFDEAQKLLKEAFSLCAKDCSQNVLIEGKFAEGLIYFELKDFRKSEISLLKSYKLSVKEKNDRFQIENIVYLSNIYFQQGNIEKAKKYLLEGERLAEMGDYNLLKINLYDQFSTLYNDINDYNNASKYQGLYIQLRDSMYGVALTQNLMVAQAEYEQRENKELIKSQSNILVLKEQVIKRQQIQNILVVSAVLLSLVIIALLYINNLQKRKSNELMEQKVQEHTRELELDYDIIKSAYEDQDRFIRKTFIDVENSLNSIKGLCFLGEVEFTDHETLQYITQIHVKTQQIFLLLKVTRKSF